MSAMTAAQSTSCCGFPLEASAPSLPASAIVLAPPVPAGVSRPPEPAEPVVADMPPLPEPPVPDAVIGGACIPPLPVWSGDPIPGAASSCFESEQASTNVHSASSVIAQRIPRAMETSDLSNRSDYAYRNHVCLATHELPL
jgi:hypothetical protein